MRKIYIVIIIILVILFSLIYFSVFGIQTVSTDKNVYSVGEKVFVSWSDFRLYKCTCMGPEVEFYRETVNGWEMIELHPPYWSVICVNGTAESGPFPCDVVMCSLSFSVARGNYTWNSKIYKRKGETEICEVPDWLRVEFPIPSYDLLIAPPGRYKVKFGTAEKVFEIR